MMGAEFIFSTSFVKVMIIRVDLCGIKTEKEKKEIFALWLASIKRNVKWGKFFEIAIFFPFTALPALTSNEAPEKKRLNEKSVR